MSIEQAFVMSWEDLKADEAAVLLIWRDKITQAMAQDKPSIVGFYKAMLVRHLSKTKGLYRKLLPEQVADIADDLKFIHEPWLNFHITHIRTKLGMIHRPESRLASFTFWQLVLADAEYSKFLYLNFKEMKGQEEALARLAAIIYQPMPGKFNDTMIDEYAAAMPKALTFDYKYLILHTYSNCRRYISETRCPTLFGSSSGSAESEPVYTGAMWQQLTFDLAETPAFAGLDTAKNARMYDALDYLEKKAKEQTKRK